MANFKIGNLVITSGEALIPNSIGVITGISEDNPDADNEFIVNFGDETGTCTVHADDMVCHNIVANHTGQVAVGPEQDSADDEKLLLPFGNINEAVLFLFESGFDPADIADMTFENIEADSKQHSARHKTDEQLRDEYTPKIKAFTDERLTAENAKRIYNFLEPYNYDMGGWHLYGAAKSIMKTNVCYAFPAEDNMGYFEELDGNGLLKWLEIAEFAEKEYELLPGGYEKLSTHTLDENSSKYQEYQDKLWIAAVRNITNSLVNKRPHLLEGFWNRLSFIENILEKGFPTRDELNAKIKLEAKKVFDSATEDDLTSFHSEVEIKHQIRNELFDISMTDEMVQALWIKDDVLGEAYRFYLENHKDNQVFLAVLDYLEEAEHDYLTFRVFDLVKLEYEGYLDEVRKMPPDKIIDEAYKLTALHDIHISLEPETSNFNTEQLKALRSLDSPLWSLYHEFHRREWTLMEDIKDVIFDVAYKQAAENRENSFEDENELDYDDELDL